MSTDLNGHAPSHSEARLQSWVDQVHPRDVADAYYRHADLAISLARTLHSDRDPELVVARAFTSTFLALGPEATRPSTFGDALFTAIYREALRHGESPEASQTSPAHLECLRRALRRLPAPDRRTLWVAFVDGRRNEAANRALQALRESFLIELSDSTAQPDRADATAGLLVSYLEGELSRARAVRVAAHLDRCPSCRARLAFLESSCDLLEEHRIGSDLLALAPFVLAGTDRRRAMRRLRDRRATS